MGDRTNNIFSECSTFSYISIIYNVVQRHKDNCRTMVYLMYSRGRVKKPIFLCHASSLRDQLARAQRGVAEGTRTPLSPNHFFDGRGFTTIS